MQITCNVTTEHMRTYFTHFYGHSKTVKRQRLIGQLATTPVFVLMAILKLGGLPWANTLFWSGIFAMWMLFFGIHHRRHLIRTNIKLHQEELGDSNIGKHTLEITESGFVDRQERGKTEVFCDKINSVETAEDYTIVYVGPASAIITPTTAVTEGNVDAFVAALKQRHEGAVVESS